MTGSTPNDARDTGSTNRSGCPENGAGDSANADVAPDATADATPDTPSGEPGAKGPHNKGGRPKGRKSRPHSVLVAETLSKQLFDVLRKNPDYVAKLKPHDQVQLAKTFAPIIRQLADSFTPHNDDRTFRIRFAGAVDEPTPLPPDTAIPELEDDTPASEVRVEASGVEVEALRAAAGEQARIAAEDEDAARRQAAHDDALASRYSEGIPRRADA